jgi:hypothetical protein
MLPMEIQKIALHQNMREFCAESSHFRLGETVLPTMNLLWDAK